MGRGRSRGSGGHGTARDGAGGAGAACFLSSKAHAVGPKWRNAPRACCAGGFI